MHMLGLDDDGDYEDHTPSISREHRSPGADRTPPASTRTSSVVPLDQTGQVVSLGDSGAVSSPRPQRPSRPASEPSGEPQPVVRPVPVASNAKPHIVRPSSFDQAQVVADSYKLSQPVVMDLQDAERDLARRLIDFASGLCYGLGGQMERLDTQVYLLTPTNVSVSESERRRLRDSGYDS